MLTKYKFRLVVLLAATLVVGIFGVNQVWSAVKQADLLNGVGGDNQSVSSPEIDALNADIARKKQAIADLQAQQEAYQKVLDQKAAEKADLKNQLSIYDNRLASLETSLDKIKLNIEETKLEMKKLDLEIATKEDQIKTEKSQIATALSLLYQEGDKSDIEIMLTKDNFSDYIDQIKHLKDLNSGISASLDDLKAKQTSLLADRKDLTDKQDSLVKLQADLEANQEDITNQKGAKEILLSNTKASEAEYQKLFTKAKAEQLAAESDVTNLEKTIRQKLAGNSQFNSLDTADEGLIWPVPKNTITAYFHDPAYPFRQVFEHPAIDIRTPQGTPVKAAASGYVARAKDGGATGYSYIMLVHNDGLSTVYGHVSVISVKEEQYVTQGQIIGMSGGMPGAHGSGPFTTGPHMHFEVRLNGIPVNPLDYLAN